MAKKIITLQKRIVIDSFLVFLFFLDFGMLFTGELVHEIAGSIAFMLILIHVYAGRTWFFSLGKKKPGTKQGILLLLNFSLAFAMLLLFASGFALLFMTSAGMIVRQVHTISAYWSLLLLGAHGGLYWERVRAFTYPLRKIFHTLFTLFIYAMALYGIYACFAIGLFGKLFQANSFEFLDESSFVFLLQRIAILCLSGVLVRYVLFLLSKRKTLT